jgi:phage shock protein PspC (stress-responsive transcriptional regulator)
MTQRQGLFRSRTDKVLGGVCGGLAKSLNTDPFILRLIFAILFLFAGGGILIYIILWIALPEEPFPYYETGTPTAEPAPEAGQQPVNPEQPVYYPNRNNGALIVGLILIGIGLVFLADRFIPTIHFGDFWPIIIVIAGLALIVTSFSKNKTN